MNLGSNSVSTYIVELFRWNPTENVYEKKDDCILSLDLNNGDLSIGTSSISNTSCISNTSSISNTPYVKVNVIKDNFAIISRERHNIASLYNTLTITSTSSSSRGSLTIDYEMRYNEHKFGIRFDSSSTASERIFFDEYTKLRSKYQFTERYPSGNIKVEGTKTASGYDGLCVEYYDKTGSPIKYIGEYERGKYDGEGEFFSSDGNIRLCCKNINAGKPNGTGRLVVGRNRHVEYIQMKEFSDLSAMDTMYTCDIYSRINSEYDEVMELLNFEKKTLEDRTNKIIF